MSERMPRLTSAQIAKVLERAGFVLVRQSGSHMIYKNDVGTRATIPNHAGKIIHPKLLKSIMREADLTVIELLDLLK